MMAIRLLTEEFNVLVYRLFGTSATDSLSSIDLASPVSPINNEFILSFFDRWSLPVFAAQSNNPFLTCSYPTTEGANLKTSASITFFPFRFPQLFANVCISFISCSVMTSSSRFSYSIEVANRNGSILPLFLIFSINPTITTCSPIDIFFVSSSNSTTDNLSRSLKLSRSCNSILTAFLTLTSYLLPNFLLQLIHLVTLVELV